MGFRAQIVIVAKGEADITWYSNTDRILEYFATSTGKTWTRESARTISWCTYFAHWVLVKAGVKPLPLAGTYDSLSDVGGSVGRFLKYSPDALKQTKHTGNGVYEFHSVSAKTYTPRAGDLYYLPNHNNHVGVIVGVSGDQIWTVDGNAGPGGFDKRFFITWGKGGTPVKRIGDGFVYQPSAPKTLKAGDFYIEIPEG
jgi:hypothetical protein